MALDEDSQKYLEEAKKGKPRKFAMLCKGVSIVGLKVYKKGTEEKYKKELKKEATGQFYSGVITGKGQKLVFQLLQDECEKPPTKDITLKEYLSDEAEMKFKPTFELVASLEGETKQKDDEAPKKKASGKNSDRDAANANSAKKSSSTKKSSGSPKAPRQNAATGNRNALGSPRMGDAN